MKTSPVCFGDIGVIYCKNEKMGDAQRLLANLKRDYKDDFYQAENWLPAAKTGEVPRFVYTTGEQKDDKNHSFPDLYQRGYLTYSQSPDSQIKRPIPEGLQSINGSVHAQHRANFTWRRNTHTEEGVLRTHWVV